MQSRQRAAMDYALANLIGIAFHDPKHIPKTVSQAYPGLFEDQRKTADWTIIKANMLAYQKTYNARQRKAGDKD